MVNPLKLSSINLSTFKKSPLSLQSVCTNCGGVHGDSSENLSGIDPSPSASPSPSAIPSELPSPNSTPCDYSSSLIPKSVDSLPSDSPGLCFVPSEDPSCLIPVECPSSSSVCSNGSPKDVTTYKHEDPPNITSNSSCSKPST